MTEDLSQNVRSSQDRRRPPKSPCTGICEIGPSQICRGCQRTLFEIAQWGRATPALQWEIVDRARARAGGAAPPRIQSPGARPGSC